MFTLISPEKTQLRPGTVVKLPGTWEEYQTLLQQRKDSSIPRLKYRGGEILLMSPLPEHGRKASLVADVVKVCLDAYRQNYEAFTPVTIELPSMGGIEPDYCFYIDNWEAVRGMDRINWETEPPPDLAIEIDVTSYTEVEDYLPYRIPEVWLIRGDRLQIYSLQEDAYAVQPRSRFFPNLDIPVLLAECFEQAATQGSGAAIWELRDKLS